MRPSLRLFLFAAFQWFAVLAFAQTEAREWSQQAFTPQIWRANGTAVCNDILAARNADGNGQTHSNATYTQDNYFSGSCRTQYTFLGSVTYSYASVISRACAAGQPCGTPEASQCEAKKGVTSIVNRTVGFTRSSDDNDFAVVGAVTKSSTGSLVCHNGCASQIQPVTSSTAGAGAYRSLVPNAQGLYRMSLDLPVTNTGNSCAPGAEGSTTEAAAQNPLTPSPLCPGYVGEVNGRKGCYGTAERPVTTAPADRPPIPNEGGNPAAGSRPESGEGSGSGGTGRTPAAGTGDNNGGPSSAATAGRPSGTASSPASGTEQLECGAPGQPRCRIDESGTPSEWDPSDLKKHADKYKTDTEANRGKVSGKDDKGFFDGWGVVFFAPPIVECTPFVLPRDMGSLDPCPVASGMRLVMAWIWAVGGLALCARMIYKVV